VLKHPKHPYVQLLIDSVPVPDPRQRWEGRITLPVGGETQTAAGCLYAPRCPHRMDKCTEAAPDLYETAAGQRAACYLYEPGGTGGPSQTSTTTIAHGG
jgi:oligopeptide/dipeptide ABC transporter ATP-binding protein